MSMATTRSVVGVDIDGTRVTVVAISDGGIAGIHQADESTVTGSLTVALATVRRTDPVRVYAAVDGTRMARIDVTAAMARRAVFMRAAYAATGVPEQGTTTAGLFFDASALTADVLGSGVAAAAPAAPITELYELFGPRQVEVVPAPFTAGALDGVSLALRYSTAELTLVHAGLPVAYQQLPTGGLDTVEATLGSGTAVGRTRVLSAMTGSATSDPIAAGALERYLRSVLDAARDTLADWSRAGERTSRTLYVHGPGARSRALGVLLGDAGLERGEAPTLQAALIHLDPNDRAGAVGAYLAASTFGDRMPHTAFPNPNLVAAAEAAERRARARRRARLYAGLGVLAMAGAVVPTVGGAIDVGVADHQLSTAVSQRPAAAPGAVLAAARRYDAAGRLRAVPDTAQTMSAIYQAAPSGLTVTDVTVAPAPGAGAAASTPGAEATAETVTVTGTAPSVAVVTAYVQRLSVVPGTGTVVPASITARAASTGFVLTFDLPSPPAADSPAAGPSHPISVALSSSSTAGR
jgi:hypothetical protein